MNSRWKCPSCNSDEVQISLPAWHTETKELELTYVETDSEAEIMWWWCPHCGATGNGDPDENDE